MKNTDIFSQTDFDKDGDIVAQMYEIAKKNNLFDKEDVFEEGDE